MRKIAYVTGSRADFGISRPVLDELGKRPDIALDLLVCGMHLSEAFGRSVDEIAAAGYAIGARIDMLEAGDGPVQTARAMARGIDGFADHFSRNLPDLLVVLGDRFEMYSAAIAALPFNIPVAHLHGGELTLGAFDDALRHSMTKLSHLHFVSTAETARRVRQLGEEEWRVVISGAPSLDNLRHVELLDKAALTNRLGIEPEDGSLLVTFHPVTLEPGQAASQIAELLAALETIGRQIIFTMPNADPDNSVISAAIDRFVSEHPNAHARDNLGTQVYFSLMATCTAMVGNSSSGLIEAPSFELPVVNIGIRQQGRVRAANVIDTDCARHGIANAIEKATSPEFRQSLRGLVNPYGDGHAAAVIADGLAGAALDETLTRKAFVDLESA
jgi:UDP-hydrolysing UDP-N-acetyl-D-glucosamine 2-epimerase